MKIKSLFLVSVLALLSGISASAATLGVNASATPSGSLFNYTYTFSVTGPGGVDNIFLGSDDLSPLSVAFTVNGSASMNWSWLGNDVPQNYLQLFSTNGSTLGSGDSLGLKFTSSFAPASTHFAVGLNSSTSAVTNQVTGVLAPTAVPEPVAFEMALAAALILAVGSTLVQPHRP